MSDDAPRYARCAGCGRELAPIPSSVVAFCDAACIERARAVRPLPRRLRRRSVWWTAAEDRVLIETYDSLPGSVPRLARRLGRPEAHVRVRAREMGLCRITRRPWTEEEDARLAELVADGVSLPRIQRALGRNMEGMRARIYRIGLTVAHIRDARGWYTCEDVGAILGVTADTVVRRIHAGALRASHDGAACHWRITARALRRYLIEHWHSVDLARVQRCGDRLALLDLLAGGQFGLGPIAEGDTVGGGDDAAVDA